MVTHILGQVKPNTNLIDWYTIPPSPHFTPLDVQICFPQDKNDIQLCRCVLVYVGCLNFTSLGRMMGIIFCFALMSWLTTTDTARAAGQPVAAV